MSRSEQKRVFTAVVLAVCAAGIVLLPLVASLLGSEIVEKIRVSSARTRWAISQSPILPDNPPNVDLRHLGFSGSISGEQELRDTIEIDLESHRSDQAIEKQAPKWPGDSQSNQPLQPRWPRVIMFTSDWCIPCIESKKGSEDGRREGFENWLVDAGWCVGESIDDHVQYVNIDYASNFDLVNRYKVRLIPVFVEVRDQQQFDAGKYDQIHTGYCDRKTIKKLLRRWVKDDG